MLKNSSEIFDGHELGKEIALTSVKTSYEAIQYAEIDKQTSRS